MKRPPFPRLRSGLQRQTLVYPVSGGLAVERYAALRLPAIASFVGWRSLSAALAEVARAEADRLSLVIETTLPEHRDRSEAPDLDDWARWTVRIAWARAVAPFGRPAEPWAAEAWDEAVRAYSERLDEIDPLIGTGGHA